MILLLGFKSDGDDPYCELEVTGKDAQYLASFLQVPGAHLMQHAVVNFLSRALTDEEISERFNRGRGDSPQADIFDELPLTGSR